MAKVQAVTVALHTKTDDFDRVRRVANRFEKLNEIPVKILRNRDLGGTYLSYPTFGRYHMWRLVPPDTETIVYFDYDILPLRPLPKLPSEDLAAVPGNPEQVADVKKYWPIFRRNAEMDYFNSGLLVLTRKTEKLFADVLARQTHANEAKWPWLRDQTLLNIEAQVAVQNGDITYKQLPKSWNYLVLGERDLVADPHMIHFARGGDHRLRLMDILLQHLK